MDERPGGTVTREAIIWAYRLILGREPENEIAISGKLSINGLEALRRTLLSGKEFGVSHIDVLCRLACSLHFDAGWELTTRRYYYEIEHSSISLNSITELYASAGLAENQYTKYHLRRFHELFGHLATRFRERTETVNLLEIGTSAHTTPFYRKFLRCELDTICRPVELGGPAQRWAAAAGSRRHWELDLNLLDPCAKDISAIPNDYYDAVVCCEVIEHLTKPPRDIVAIALAKLKSKGVLYLTTPNFLTPEKLAKVYSGRNPAAHFQNFEHNIDAHHHFREYTSRELLDEINSVGGCITDVVFSNCWDHPKYSDYRESATDQTL